MYKQTFGGGGGGQKIKKSSIFSLGLGGTILCG